MDISFKKQQIFLFLILGMMVALGILLNNREENLKHQQQDASFNMLEENTVLNYPPENTRGKKIMPPDGYKLLYSEDFEDNQLLTDFTMTDANAWRISQNDGNYALELYQQSDYQPRVRTPRNIAFNNKEQFGSFVLEVDLLQTGREYGHRDMCIFYGIKDPSNFYYTHFATATDPHAHNIFLVNDEDRIKISSKTSEGIDWGENEWHTIRIERNIEEGTIKVYFDDLENPIMEATDKHFDYGYIGFGSFDDTGMVDNIKVWGPEKAPEKKHFFDVRAEQ